MKVIFGPLVDISLEAATRFHTEQTLILPCATVIEGCALSSRGA